MSPYNSRRDKPSSGQGKEICDLLVVFDRDVFVFSDKSVGWNDDSELEVAWSRWRRGAIEKSLRQLDGAFSHLIRNPEDVFLDKGLTRRLPVRIPPYENGNYHLILVAHGAGKACSANFQCSRGSLVVHTGLSCDDQEPFVVGEYTPKGRFVHVFDEATVGLMLGELDTIADFRDYICAKEAFVRNGGELIYCGEEDLLAFYLGNRNPVREGASALAALGGHLKEGQVESALQIEEGAWDHHIATGDWARTRDMVSGSYAWDRLIERFVHHSLTDSQFWPAKHGVRGTERNVRQLSRESRFGRRHIVSICSQALAAGSQRPWRLWCVQSPANHGLLYVFLSLNYEGRMTYEEFRRWRLHVLSVALVVMSQSQTQFDEYLGISMAGTSSAEFSEDIMLLDESLVTAEVLDQVREFQDETGFGSLMAPSKVDPLRGSKLRAFREPVGNERNQICHCGSGKKWKKCCAR